MVIPSEEHGSPLFIGTEQLGLLSKWLDDLDRAVYGRVIDNAGTQGFDVVDVRALNKLLPFGGDVLGCVNPANAQKCLSLIGDLQRGAVAFSGGLWDLTESSAEMQQADSRLNRALSKAMPFFHWLRVRLSEKLATDADERKQAQIKRPSIRKEEANIRCGQH